MRFILIGLLGCFVSLLHALDFHTMRAEQKEILFALAQIETVFDQGANRHGQGILLSKNGYVLTQAHLVHDFEQNEYATEVLIKVQDTLNDPPICFATAEVRAVDDARELAILQVNAYTDVYCNPAKTVSTFHSGYFPKHALDVFKDLGVDCNYLPKEGFTVHLPLFPNIWKEVVRIKSGVVQEMLYRQDSSGLRYAVGYRSDIPYPKESAGGMVLDSGFHLIGMSYFYHDESKKIDDKKIISAPVVFSWLCHLSDLGVITLDAPGSTEGERIPLYQHAYCQQVKDGNIF